MPTAVKADERERRDLIKWLRKNEQYGLDWDENTMPIAKLRAVKEAVEQIVNTLKETARSIRQIGNRNPKLGIGDTHVDEAIAEDFYDRFHFGG